MEVSYWCYALGFVAQGLFSARMIIQWILSERARKVVSPTIYWQLSLLASILFSLYGWMRGDFAIIFGQIFSYYIYIWNLNNKNHWKEIFPTVRAAILLIPIVALGYVLYNGNGSSDRLFGHINVWLLIFGSTGQVIFTFRFIYQWWYSRSRGESVLPLTFWLLSIIGSFIIVAYGVFRQDLVLIIGQSVGFVTYSRNLWLILKEKKEIIKEQIK